MHSLKAALQRSRLVRDHHTKLGGTIGCNIHHKAAANFYNIRRFVSSDDDKDLRPRPISESNKPIVQSNSPVPSDNATKSWNWVPPRASLRTDDEVIPVILGAYLTTEEIKLALENQGAADVVVIPLQERLENISHLVIASGRSTRHLSKMSEAIVKALKARKLPLKKIQNNSFSEGDKDDDWVLVDCQTTLVHLMLPATRRALDLESHWQGKHRPAVQYSADEDTYESNFNRLLEQYPVPDDYNPLKEYESHSNSKQRGEPQTLEYMAANSTSTSTSTSMSRSSLRRDVRSTGQRLDEDPSYGNYERKEQPMFKQGRGGDDEDVDSREDRGGRSERGGRLGREVGRDEGRDESREERGGGGRGGREDRDHRGDEIERGGLRHREMERDRRERGRERGGAEGYDEFDSEDGYQERKNGSASARGRNEQEERGSRERGGDVGGRMISRDRGAGGRGGDSGMEGNKEDMNMDRGGRGGRVEGRKGRERGSDGGAGRDDSRDRGRDMMKGREGGGRGGGGAAAKRGKEVVAGRSWDDLPMFPGTDGIDTLIQQNDDDDDDSDGGMRTTSGTTRGGGGGRGGGRGVGGGGRGGGVGGGGKQQSHHLDDDDDEFLFGEKLKEFLGREAEEELEAMAIEDTAPMVKGQGGKDKEGGIRKLVKSSPRVRAGGRGRIVRPLARRKKVDDENEEGEDGI